MKTLLITLDYLIERGACWPQRREFERLFPGGVIPTEELATQYAKCFDWEWAYDYLLIEERALAAAEECDAYYREQNAGLNTAAEELEKGGHNEAAWETYRTTCTRLYDEAKAEYGRIFVRHFIAQGGRELMQGETCNEEP